MRPSEGSPSLPGWRTAQDGIARIRRMLSAAPPVVKIVLIGILVVFFPVVLSVVLVIALAYAPYAVFSGRPGVAASLAVAIWGVAIVTGLSGGQQPWLVALLALPFAAVAAAQAGSIGRWFVPCRTVTWALLWALPVGIARLAYRRRTSR